MSRLALAPPRTIRPQQLETRDPVWYENLSGVVSCPENSNINTEGLDHRLIFSGPSMSQFKLKSGRLPAGDVTHGKNKTSIMRIGLSSILSVLFKSKKIKE